MNLQLFRVSSYLIVLLVLVALSAWTNEAKCAIKAVFNFGDSNTDTGGFWAAFPEELPPYGMTYFKKPAGRGTDGRVVVDFLAQALGVPFLCPYLQSIGSNFKHGANFATSPSTVLLPNTSLFVTGISPFSLATQINQMKELKSRVDELHSKGGRTFMVLNLAPIGCYPAFLVELPRDSSDIDEFGCLISYNNAVVDYNNMLKEALRQTRQELADASVIYTDTHSVLLELFRHPSAHGLQHGTTSCCGYGGGAYNFDKNVFCGTSRVIGGKRVTATACNDPYNSVSFDGIHATDAANKHIAYAILNGSYFDAPFSLHQLCDIQHIG